LNPSPVDVVHAYGIHKPCHDVRLFDALGNGVLDVAVDERDTLVVEVRGVALFSAMLAMSFTGMLSVSFEGPSKKDPVPWDPAFHLRPLERPS
jgi:hypothetical protein